MQWPSLPHLTLILKLDLRTPLGGAGCGGAGLRLCAVTCIAKIRINAFLLQEQHQLGPAEDEAPKNAAFDQPHTEEENAPPQCYAQGTGFICHLVQ